jgi:hypothetical protein
MRMNSTSRSERHRLTRQLEQARTELRESYEGLSDEQMTQAGAVGDWSVKDVLSHVASWEEFALPDMGRLARGDMPVLAGIDLYSTDYDDINGMIMSLRLYLPLDQVLRELDLIHADFLAALDRLPDSVLAEGEFGRVLIQITAEHDSEHAGDIRKWRERKAS